MLDFVCLTTHLTTKLMGQEEDNTYFLRRVESDPEYAGGWTRCSRVSLHPLSYHFITCKEKLSTFDFSGTDLRFVEARTGNWHFDEIMPSVLNFGTCKSYYD